MQTGEWLFIDTAQLSPKNQILQSGKGGNKTPGNSGYFRVLTGLIRAQVGGLLLL
ncbi:hypothetical protein PU088_002510 [Citrobacter farmeri]|uniref:hypothetical protein n=1 Tax=Citrobacter amalonaticus TaxID=35703 RepID=UPI0012D3FC70|nr:hypothetical protein [Citrobacter amalonaticus]EKV5655007.1 hypothetical protein [Citrobacter farmeri]